jgi:hypothetical protein
VKKPRESQIHLGEVPRIRDTPVARMIQIISCQVKEWRIPLNSKVYFHREAMHEIREAKGKKGKGAKK